MLMKRGYITKRERKALRELSEAFDHHIRFEAVEEFGREMIARNRPAPPRIRVDIRFDRQSRKL